MLSRRRQCLACDYTWSRYLDFPTCPKCNQNVLEATIGREVSRTKKIAGVAVAIGIAISILAEILRPFF